MNAGMSAVSKRSILVFAYFSVVIVANISLAFFHASNLFVWRCVFIMTGLPCYDGESDQSGSI